MDAGPQHGRALALAQYPGGDHQLQQLLGVARADDVQRFAQQLLLVGKELDLHLEEVVLVVLGARELRDPAVQIWCGANQGLELAARQLLSRLPEQRRRQLQVDQVAMVDLQEAQANRDCVARPLVCHTAVRLEVILHGGRVEVDMVV